MLFSCLALPGTEGWPSTRWEFCPLLITKQSRQFHHFVAPSTALPDPAELNYTFCYPYAKAVPKRMRPPTRLIKVRRGSL
jgi:hypothetical protein